MDISTPLEPPITVASRSPTSCSNCAVLFSGSALLQQMDNFPRPFGERRAGIAIAHFGIQRIQAIFEIDKCPRRRRDQRFYLWVFRRFDFQLVVNRVVALGFHRRKRHRFLPADGLYIGINGFLKCLVQA
jgi:hypothetical protein